MASVLAVGRAGYFYPRSPCGERPTYRILRAKLSPISIHALLAESDTQGVFNLFANPGISIHALLAESDHPVGRDEEPFRGYFYPRSPCGERPALAVLLMCNLYFYPRSPCGERRVHYDNYNLHCVISIHALLAESDISTNNHIRVRENFYPRSPCGERQWTPLNSPVRCYFYPRSPCGERPLALCSCGGACDFYPRSPCGERH